MDKNPILPNGVTYEDEMHIIGTSAVVFLTIFILMYGLFPEDFIKKVKPAVIVFRISQILLSVLIIIPEKERHASEKQKEKFEAPIQRAIKAWNMAIA
jgi:hypothetical protein